MKESTLPSKTDNLPQSKNSDVVWAFKVRPIHDTPGRIEVHPPRHWIVEGEDIVAPSVCFVEVRSFNPSVRYLADKKLATTLRRVADLIDSIAVK